MIRVAVHNFQAWERAEFEVRGITAIVGATNGGKSSLLRAIMVALFSRTGNDFIRDGEDATRVELSFDAPHPPLEVVFEKTRDKSPVWTINGEEYTNAGRLGPREIFQQHGIYEYEVNSGRYNLVCQAQLEPLFVLRLPATQAYEVFAKVFERSDLGPVIAKAATQARSLAQTITWTKGALSAAERSLEVSRQQVALLAPLPSLSQLDLLEHLSEQVDEVSGWHLEVTMAEERVSTHWAAASAFQLLYEASASLLERVDKAEGEHSAVSEALAQVRRAEYEAFLQAGQVEYAEEALGQVEGPHLLAALDKFIAVRILLGELDEAEKNAARYGEEARAELQEALAEVDRELATFDACPLCDRPLEGMHGC